MSKAEAARMIRDQIAAWRGTERNTFGARDLFPLLDETGRSPSWLYEVLRAMEGDGTLARKGSSAGWEWEILLPADAVAE